MTIRAYIRDNLMSQRLDIAIIDHLPETIGHRAMIFRDGRMVGWDTIAPEDYTSTPEPTLSLPREAGRALLDALAAHFDGAEDTRQLRHDYERERARVDEQAKVLADVVRSLAGAAGGPR